jgi:hypothetical protein
MFKLAGFILSFIILAQSFGLNLSGLAQMDDLWSHYQEHQEEYGDDLITFLDLHYGSQKGEHEDEHSGHQDLPSQHNIHIHFNYIVENVFSDYFIELPAIDIQHNFGYSAIFKSLLETEILQPPRTIA